MHPECSFHRWLLGEVSVRKIAWFSVIFRDRSVMRGQRNVKRRKRKSERPGGRERDGPVWRGSSKRTKRAGERAGRQASKNRRSLGASPWLRSVPGYGQLFFTLRANDRYVFFAPRLDVSFRRGLSLLVFALCSLSAFPLVPPPNKAPLELAFSSSSPAPFHPVFFSCPSVSFHNLHALFTSHQLRAIMSSQSRK